MTPATLAPSRAPAPPGDLAVWVFILAELLVFGIFFLAYAFARVSEPALFDLHQAELNRTAGLINTVLLITASWFVAKGVGTMSRRDGSPGERRCGPRCGRCLLLAAALGLGFVVVKGVEYAHHVGAGITLSTNTFYMFYLSLTFFHFMHVLLGLVVLVVIGIKARRGAYAPGDLNAAESGAAYWHMVDLVWLVLFPLVYVMR